ncbi:MAG: SIR2 family NAD-dependent protein deacylase [Candidatus Methanofastidiosia archaeon]
MEKITEHLIEKVAKYLVKSNYAIALTGAGISTESKIPDYRGPSGIWTKDPEAEKRAYRAYQTFLVNPVKYWEERLTTISLLGDLEKAKTNPGHYALFELEKMGVLKCIITQNIDNLHKKAGSKNVLEYHGNALKFRCALCNTRFESGTFNLEKLKREKKLPPVCKKCKGIIKSDIVHFGEPIPSDVACKSLEEAHKCDLMLICGTSAAVYPFAALPRTAKERINGKDTMIIEINIRPTSLTDEKISDYFIRGKTGEVLPKIVDVVKKINK